VAPEVGARAESGGEGPRKTDEHLEKALLQHSGQGR